MHKFVLGQQGASQLLETMSTALVQPLGSSAGGGRGHQYLGTASEATPQSAFQTYGCISTWWNPGGLCSHAFCHIFVAVVVYYGLCFSLISENKLRFVGCHWDSLRGSNDAAASSERENGATALAPSSRTRPLGEPLKRTGTCVCLHEKKKKMQFKLLNLKKHLLVMILWMCVLSLSQRMQLDIILTSLQDHTHVASLLGYSCPPDTSEPSAPPSDSVAGTHSDTHPDTHLAEILMKTLLRNLGFYTVSL